MLTAVGLAALLGSADKYYEEHRSLSKSLHRIIGKSCREVQPDEVGRGTEDGWWVAVSGTLLAEDRGKNGIRPLFAVQKVLILLHQY